MEEIFGNTTKYKVGDKIKANVCWQKIETVVTPYFEGTIVYVHPLNRFYTVEFRFGDATFRESYLIREA